MLGEQKWETNVELLALFKRVEETINNLSGWRRFLFESYSPTTYWINTKWVKNIENDLKEAKDLIARYNLIRPPKLPYVKLPYFNEKTLKTANVDQVTVIITTIIRTLGEVHIYLSSFLKLQLSEKDKQKLNSLRKELSKIEEQAYNIEIIKNLKEALREAESGHCLASSLISARVILYCIEQIDGKTDEDKAKTLKNLNIIPEGEKSSETFKWFLKAIKSARHAISHKITLFPQPSDMFSILGDAFKMAKITHKYQMVKK